MNLTGPVDWSEELSSLVASSVAYVVLCIVFLSCGSRIVVVGVVVVGVVVVGVVVVGVVVVGVVVGCAC